MTDGYPQGLANGTVTMHVDAAPEVSADSTYAAFVGFATSTAGIATFAAVGGVLLIGAITAVTLAIKHSKAKQMESIYHSTLASQGIALSTIALTANAQGAQAEELKNSHQQEYPDAMQEYDNAEYHYHIQEAESILL